MAYMCAKLDDYSFSHSRNINEAPKMYK